MGGGGGGGGLTRLGRPRAGGYGYRRTSSKPLVTSSVRRVWCFLCKSRNLGGGGGGGGGASQTAMLHVKFCIRFMLL